MEFFFDGGDCCLNETSQHCFKGLKICIESEIGDGICQDYNNGKSSHPSFTVYSISYLF